MPRLFGVILLSIFLSDCVNTKEEDGCIQKIKNRNSTGTETNKNNEKLFKYLSDNHPCRRTCKAEAPPMLCYYDFKIDWYKTLTSACHDCPYNIMDCFRKDCVPGDGITREIVTINKKLPGPSIEVCQNDIIIVDVHNKLFSEATTIHWHGQTQRESPYMDGLPYITQCPILPCSSFRYTFKASQAGTHFWHSHMAMQRIDGAFGALIVRVLKEKDHHKQLYDDDLSSHIMVINDWDSEVGADMLLHHFYTGSPTAPPSLLVNGLGRRKIFYTESGKTFVPTARFKVIKGFRYRFRVINAGSLNCPIEITVDNHMIEVISTDGVDIEPIKAKSLITYAGERFDFILHANQPEDLYWIKFKGLINCNDRKAFQIAVLEYNDIDLPINSYPTGTVDYFSAHNNGMQVNPLNKEMKNDSSVFPVSRMKSVQKWDKSLKFKPDFQYYVGFDFYNITNRDFYRETYKEALNLKNSIKRILTPQFNYISMKLPTFALLPQRDEIQGDIFCNNETTKEKNCSKVHCQCLHGIKIPLGAVVEFVFVDEGFSYDVNHPLHLHGYHFRVTAMEKVASSVTVENIKERDAMGLIRRNLVDAPLKDTVTVPDGGYTVVRFLANSPGYWLLHCHIDVHMVLGMAMILQIGEKKDMVPVPKDFPKCGDFMPKLKTDFDVDKKNIGVTFQISLLFYSIILSNIVVGFY